MHIIDFSEFYTNFHNENAHLIGHNFLAVLSSAALIGGSREYQGLTNPLKNI